MNLLVVYLISMAGILREVKAVSLPLEISQGLPQSVLRDPVYAVFYRLEKKVEEVMAPWVWSHEPLGCWCRQLSISFNRDIPVETLSHAAQSGTLSRYPSRFTSLSTSLDYPIAFWCIIRSVRLNRSLQDNILPHSV